jgi:hypothetical protein
MSTKPLLAGFGLVLVLGAAVLGLRSLEKAAGPAAAPRADSSTQAKPADEISAPAPDAAFALHACRVHMQDQAPQLELHFTQPLQAEGGGWASLTVADLGPLQGATPASAAAGATPQGQRVRGYWRQTEDARVLRFAGVQPQRRYRVQAGEGLKSVDGVALPAVAHCELATTPTPPAHYFASRGTVLPAGQNGGLPVATVNTPEVDVQFLRVAPAALPRFLERLAGGRNPGAADDEGEGGYDDPGNSLQGRTSGWQLEQWKAYAEPVHLARYRTEGPADQRRNHFLPVEHIAELQQPGVYLAVMNRPGRFDNDYQVTHFYVSDIGLQLQRQSEGLSVFVSSLKSGKALAGVRVELLDAHGRLKAAQDSDADGHARFERRRPRPRWRWRARARSSPRCACARPAWTSASSTSADTPRAACACSPTPAATCTGRARPSRCRCWRATPTASPAPRSRCRPRCASPTAAASAARPGCPTRRAPATCSMRCA